MTEKTNAAQTDAPEGAAKPKPPASAGSPNARQAARERAEAEAMAEIEMAARKRREKSEELRKLRLAQDQKIAKEKLEVAKKKLGAK